MTTLKANIQARPFVKWAGGKTQLIGAIKKSLPADLGERNNLTYVEPFVGGGAVLFWILQEYPNISNAVINDINSELICTYRIIKGNVEELIAELSHIQSEYIPMSAQGRKSYFMAQRDCFNKKMNSPLHTAALFIFLNRTCFNGLYRVNSKGEFNVPHGKYVNPKICDAENLRAVSKLLQKVEILNGDFSQTRVYAGPATLYYLDPPYKPITETSSFTSYTKGGFDDAEQIRLRDFCAKVAGDGAMFLVSNSDTAISEPGVSFFDRIYEMFSIKRVLASRMINADASKRGAISEIMISNVINS